MSQSQTMARGMSLVELMISVVIGMFLVAVMGSVYLGSKATFNAQDSVSHLQDSGRFAMDTMARDLRMSGFRGCMSQVRGTPLTNLLNTPTALLYNFAEPVWGSRSSGGSWSPALGTPVSGLSPLPAGDVLVVRRPVGSGWALTAQMAAGTSAMSISATPNITKGDLLLAADCAGAVVLQATNDTPGLSSSVAHLTGVAGISPGLSSADLGRGLAHDASLWRMQTVIYYLAASVRRGGQVALWSYTNPSYDGNPSSVELVTGVERMAITFGVDSNADYAADKFQGAAGVADWTQVVSARIDLLLSGNADNSVTKAQPYRWDGAMVVPTDKKLRTTLSVAVSLRNTVP